MITYDKPIKQIVELKWESVVHGGGSGCVGEGGGGQSHCNVRVYNKLYENLCFSDNFVIIVLCTNSII